MGSLILLCSLKCSLLRSLRLSIPTTSHCSNQRTVTVQTSKKPTELLGSRLRKWRLVLAVVFVHHLIRYAAELVLFYTSTLHKEMLKGDAGTSRICCNFGIPVVLGMHARRLASIVFFKATETCLDGEFILRSCVPASRLFSCRLPYVLSCLIVPRFLLDRGCQIPALWNETKRIHSYALGLFLENLSDSTLYSYLARYDIIVVRRTT